MSASVSPEGVSGNGRREIVSIRKERRKSLEYERAKRNANGLNFTSDFNSEAGEEHLAETLIQKSTSMKSLVSDIQTRI